MSKSILESLTPEERMQLAKELAAKEKKERLEKDAKKKKYARNREARVQKIAKGWLKIEQQISAFKKEIAVMMEQQREELNEFGLIPTKSKGGFSITSQDETFRVTISRDTNPAWDETAHKGVEIIKQFLLEKGATSKEPETVELLLSLISKNANGDLEYAKVMTFLKHANTYQDAPWKEGLRLISEGYKIVLKGYGYQFHKKDQAGKWQPVSINFSSL